MRIGGAYIPACEIYSSARGYCTRPRGHVEAGDRKLTLGNGTTIAAVWTERAR